MHEIFLTPVQSGLILIGCLYIVLAGRVGWVTGIFLSLAYCNYIIRFGPVNHIWVFLMTMFGAVAVYRLRRPHGSLIPQHDVWIVPWVGLWWGWMLFILAVNDADPTIKYEIIVSLLCYTMVPLPVFLIFAPDHECLKGFALSYVLTTMVAGCQALLSGLSALNIPLSSLLTDPALTEYGAGVAQWSVYAMNLGNYHLFAYAFAISFLFILTLLQDIRRPYGHVMLIMGAAYCAYFLMLANSKQAMGGTALVGLLFTYWAARNRTTLTRLLLFLLMGLSVAAAVAIYRMRSDLVLRSAESLTEAFDVLKDRAPFWAEGWEAFLNSPLWGDGFVGSASLGHNFFISTLANQGLVGMFFLSGFLFFIAKQVPGIWTERKISERAIWRMSFACIAVFTLVVAQVSGSPVSAWALFWSAAILWRLKEQ